MIKLSFRDTIKATGDVHSWGCLMIEFPQEFCNEIQKWSNSNISDKVIYDNAEHEFGRETKSHATVAYGIDPKKDPEDIQFLLYQWRKPVKVRLGKISKFDTKPEHDVIKIEVLSKDLHEMHEECDLQLGLPGNTFPNYIPHVTIAYVKPKSCDHLLGKEPFLGKEFMLSKFEYSYPNGKKDSKIHYNLN